MKATTSRHKVLGPGEGLRLQSGPGRDLIFKVTGEDTGGAFDYFIVEVAPHGGPPLHVHHNQEETIHVLKGRYKVRIGDDTFFCQEGGFAYLPSRVPHAFLNLTDEPGEIVVSIHRGADTSSMKNWVQFRVVLIQIERSSERSSRNMTWPSLDRR
jgi:quercetin dioxygenase-like cupin family protein